MKMIHLGRLKLFPPTYWYSQTQHPNQPSNWTWWRLFAIRVYPVRNSGVSINHMVWLYTRWGACVTQVAYDTRNFQKG